jgi:hypothetical protein
MKPINEGNGYFVSDEGRVYSTHYGNLRELKQWTNLFGYRLANLRVNGKVVHRYVHLLVLDAFVGPRPAGMQARHGVHGKSVNTVSNLSWGTKSQNELDKRRDGTFSNGDKNKISRYDAWRIHKLSGIIPRRKLARLFRVSYPTIANIQLGRGKKGSLQEAA